MMGSHPSRLCPRHMPPVKWHYPLPQLPPPRHDNGNTYPPPRMHGGHQKLDEAQCLLALYGTDCLAHGTLQHVLPSEQNNNQPVQPALQQRVEDAGFSLLTHGNNVSESLINFVYYVQTLKTAPMTDSIPDPIRAAAHLVDPNAPDALERRIKQDVFDSISRIKPDATANVNFEKDVMNGSFFEGLPPPLQGIAIARTEGVLAFYNRVGWHSKFLDAELSACVPEEGLEPLSTRYHARSMHDLAYVHPKHFEKMLGKAGAASLWEAIKRFVDSSD